MAASSWQVCGGAGEHTGDEEKEYDDPHITLVPEEEGSRRYEHRNGHHDRRPDLSANITVLFQSRAARECKGVYASHGKNKTVFVLKSTRHGDYLDGEVLKVARVHDPEPGILRYLCEARQHLKGCVLGPELLYECWGHDNNKRYHCWIAERCIPLNEFAESTHADKEKCVLAACRCIAKAATVGVILSDCHFFNFGVLVSGNQKEHQVVIIDAGSRSISDMPKKSQVNECMKNLWRWAKNEIAAPFEGVRELWQQKHVLKDAAETMDAIWFRWPLLTVVEMGTAEVDEELRCKCSKALQAFMASPQQKVIALIGASACHGGWNAEMSASCFRAGRSVRASLKGEEADVLGELYQRLTLDTRGQRRRSRSSEEIDEIINFWWKLQAYRKWWLQEHHREDSEAEILTEEEITEVRGAWAWFEMWYELTPEQKRNRHLPSIYNAALNNKSGWKALANCIIKNKMPQPPARTLCDQWDRTGAIEHAAAIGHFIEDLATWLVVFAKSLAEQHRSESHKKARLSSGREPERRLYEHYTPVGDEVLEKYL